MFIKLILTFWVYLFGYLLYDLDRKELFMSPEQAKTALNYGKFIALDTESTGFQPNDKFSFLLEIGAVKSINGKIVDRFDELINPGMKIPKKIQQLTNITDDMVKDKDSFVEVLARFRKWCDTDNFIFVMHNATHDLKFLNFFGEKCGIKFDNPYIDTQPLAKNLLKGGYWNKVNSRVKENYKLATLGLFFGLDDPSHHRADNDAELTMNVFYKLRQLAFKKESMLYLKQDWKFPKNKLRVSKDNDEVSDKPTQKVKILYASPWDKKKRLYVCMVTKCSDEDKYATVYYDFDYNCWGIKDSGFPITSFKVIEDEMKKAYATETMSYENFAERKHFNDVFLSF